MNRYGPMLARVLIVGIFLYSGYGKLTNVEATAGFIASMGLPLPTVAAFASDGSQPPCSST